MRCVVGTGKPVVLVLLSGSPLSIPWADEHVGTILQAWYPGEEDGSAVADALFGRVSPAGRLPVTIPRSLDQLPPFTDFAMHGRTYRYMTETPLYPFGYGLSYTSFSYHNSRLSHEQVETENVPDDLTVTIEVVNEGSLDSDEVVQLYLTNENGQGEQPLRRLAGFRRIHLRHGERRELSFQLYAETLSWVNDYGQRILNTGKIVLAVGGGQSDKRTRELFLRLVRKERELGK